MDPEIRRAFSSMTGHRKRALTARASDAILSGGTLVWCACQHASVILYPQMACPADCQELR